MVMGIFYQVISEAAEISKKRIKVRDISETKANSSTGVWATLKRLIPNSSGRGDMIMSAPTMGRVQEKYRLWKSLVRWYLIKSWGAKEES